MQVDKFNYKAVFDTGTSLLWMRFTSSHKPNTPQNTRDCMDKCKHLYGHSNWRLIRIFHTNKEDISDESSGSKWFGLCDR